MDNKLTNKIVDLEFRLDDIEHKLYDLEDLLNVNIDTLKFKIRPSGLIKRFGGITEQRTIFETRNGVQFRVDDRDYSPLVNPPVALV